jgi:adenine-specific DNA-methyltransferase
VIKFLGSKRVLLPRILACVQALPDARRVLDLFSGTARVGHALKAAGYAVVANDHNTFAHVLARAYVQADRDRVAARARAWIRDLNALPPRAGWFTRTYCEEARFLTPRNGARVDAIRAVLRAERLDADLDAVLRTALIEAADRVDSTTGVQMAYLKAWAPRALKDLELRLPDLLPGVGHAVQADAQDAAGRHEADLAYLDPPYNQHSYRGNYHVWETLACGDEPETYGVARKRVDCRTHKSDFNSRLRIRDAMRRLVAAVRTRHVLVSFNDEGYLDREALVEILRTRGDVAVFGTDHARYVGARIGIHDPHGRRVGRVGRLRNTEYLFFASPDADALNRVREAMAAFEAGADDACRRTRRARA